MAAPPQRSGGRRAASPLKRRYDEGVCALFGELLANGSAISRDASQAMAGESIGKRGNRAVGVERPDRVLQIAHGEAIAANAHDAAWRAVEDEPAARAVEVAGKLRVDEAIRSDRQIELRPARTSRRA